MILGHARISTPIGALDLWAHDAALCAVAFDRSVADSERWLRRRFPDLETRESADPAGAATALAAYFAGRLDALDAIAVDTGGTPFQQSVWAALRRIPVGRTVSYAGLAAAVGSPRAVRAVGLANGSNPVAVVVPCHRVIGSDGSLTGYGGGLDRKRWLLAHEGAAAPAPRQKLLFPNA